MSRRRGDTDAPLDVRLWRRVRKTDGCWLWTGARRGGDRYGHIRSDAGDRTEFVHVVSFRLAYGDVPAGLEVDHTCGNTLCVRPDHLEAVTHLENVLRGRSPTVLAHLGGRCVAGHPAGESYRRKRGPRAGRIAYCRSCRQERRAAA